MFRQTLTSALLVVSLFSVSAHALTASQSVEREVVIKQADGSEVVKREKADTVVPGEKIVYSLNYFNDGQKPAQNIRLVMPVPSEIKYIEGSASKTGVLTVYSSDGGKSYANRDALQVKNDRGDLRAASADDITHIRWTVTSKVEPQTSGTLSFKGVLR